jgi:DNA-binding transcriptional LysR family regulator
MPATKPQFCLNTGDEMRRNRDYISCASTETTHDFRAFRTASRQASRRIALRLRRARAEAEVSGRHGSHGVQSTTGGAAESASPCLSEYTVARDIASGAPAELLKEYELTSLEIQVAYSNRRHLPIKVRSFANYLVEHFDTAQFPFRRTQG